MLIKPIIFGGYKMTIHPKSTFTGNAAFSKNNLEKKDFDKICKLISNTLNRDYKDQNGKGWRYWRLEKDAEVQTLRLLANRYNSDNA